MSPREEEDCERQLQELHEGRAVQPSNSEWELSVPFVQEKDGCLCLCTDYQGLSGATVEPRFSLPSIDNLFQNMPGTQVHSWLDLELDFHQLWTAKEDVPRTAFISCNCGTPFAAAEHTLQDLVRGRWQERRLLPISTRLSGKLKCYVCLELLSSAELLTESVQEIQMSSLLCGTYVGKAHTARRRGVQCRV
eukprot:Plantae.Rhodophyta-Purpureofilum_apyrenoidigerum.ctg20706.p1 GENE.Plantae.Rhodophyta-Purpureofilum_apyrenoidigerum.ctg20706~~Plantae.Rhodophyta-Purpureofilum_apyrenoidigerum.ctg20706.p1  ORF type:complete len:192 (-),score=3.95 Plantae.Rhodophyta-Purpureofilum_apyrenoidigerum.ctg20706:58-633(-)